MKHLIRRREGVVSRLEAQLASGQKPEKGSAVAKIPLTDGDRKRIERELSIVKSKI